VPGLSGFLLINPRSGKGGPAPEELRDEAARRGIDARILGEGDEAAELARSADADALGMAGGDGSLAQIAEVAIDRDLPFVCVPFGTRNHFARDLGLDRNDTIAALDAFAGTERRIDVGRVGERVFLNNVTFGVYASLVHRRESHRRRREAFARLRALLLTIANREPLGLVIDGKPVDAQVAVVANNEYALELFSLGEREQLDEGRLHLYLAPGWRVSEWDERACASLTVDAARHRIRAAVDGEPAAFETPLEFSIRPLALRVLVPPAQG
jgi:diacylglycerol kinase family enzyme